MSWGKKITILYLGFVAMMVSLVYMCLIQNDINLVTPDYYKQELAYEGRIAKIRNTKALTEKAMISLAGNNVSIQMPPALQTAHGTVKFYRPSSASKDFTKQIELSKEGLQLIDASKLERGLWSIQIECSAEGKDYFIEQKLKI